MLKIRITFVDNDKGRDELNDTLDKIKNDFNVLNTSRVYKGRGSSLYSNVYVDLEVKR